MEYYIDLILNYSSKFVSSMMSLRGKTFKIPIAFEQVRNLNANRVVVTKIKRATYCRKYPTLLVKPDGSTITIKYHEPREIIKVTKIDIVYYQGHYIN